MNMYDNEPRLLADKADAAISALAEVAACTTPLTIYKAKDKIRDAFDDIIAGNEEGRTMLYNTAPGYWECDNCGVTLRDSQIQYVDEGGTFDFCPMCGARIVEMKISR